MNSFPALCRNAFRNFLGLCFFSLCLRFQVASVRSSGSELAVVLVLIAVSIGLGAWNPWAALFAFTASVPLLNGLVQIGVLECAYPPSLVFSGIWMGVVAKKIFGAIISKLVAPIDSIARPMVSLVGAIDGAQREVEPKTGQILFGARPNAQPASSHFIFHAIGILIAAILLSVAWQFWKNWGSAEMSRVLLNRTVLGYGDPWYFLTSAFVWLQGLFYFELLFTRCDGDTAKGLNLESDDYSAATWVRPGFAVYGLTIAVFLLIQEICNIPEGWAAGSAGAGLQAPYEDISSFGSIAVSIFIFAVASIVRAPWQKLAKYLVSCIALFVMVVASWSRAAWLAGSVFILLVAVFRLDRRWMVGVIFFLFAGLGIINANADRLSWKDSRYLSRLVALARFENPTKKDSGRLNLYKKAGRMIQRHPLVGEGIGSFYRTSVSYSQADDPNGGTPDFAHNVFLQISAEEGIPIAALFCGVLSWTFYCGIYTCLRQKASGANYAGNGLLALGLTLALGAYLQTQMTANSLNVYVSNQFFFWFLIAAILAISKRESNLRFSSLTS